MRAVVAEPDHRASATVLRAGERAQLGEHLRLGRRRRQRRASLGLADRAAARRPRPARRGAGSPSAASIARDVVAARADVAVGERLGAVAGAPVRGRQGAGGRRASPAAGARCRQGRPSRVGRASSRSRRLHAVSGVAARCPAAGASPSVGRRRPSGVASSSRSWRLRGSGESCPFGAPARRPGTLPRGVVSGATLPAGRGRTSGRSSHRAAGDRRVTTRSDGRAAMPPTAVTHRRRLDSIASRRDRGERVQPQGRRRQDVRRARSRARPPCNEGVPTPRRRPRPAGGRDAGPRRP